MFSILETLFVGTFLALQGFCKEVNRVLSQLKIQLTFSQHFLSLPVIFSDVLRG